MDKTNRNTRNTPTTTTQAQQQTNRAAASAPQRTGTTVSNASAHRAQQAPSLHSPSGAHTRVVQEASNKKLDIACSILNQLSAKLATDASAMAKILQMLNKKDASTQVTLAEQFKDCSHADGLKFLICLRSIIAFFLMESLDQNLENLDTRKTILDSLNFKVGGSSFFKLSYTNVTKDTIEVIENILPKFLSSCAYLKCSKTSVGTFQLVQVVNPESVGQVQDYIFEYCNLLERGGWSETAPQKLSLYFVYGFLGKNFQVLGRLFSCLENCPRPGLKDATEQKISEFFDYFLNDLREAYIKDYGIQPNDYDDVLLYVCKALPKLVDARYHGLFSLCKDRLQADFFISLFPLQTSKGQVLLDLIYEDQNAQLMGLVSVNLVGKLEMISDVAPMTQHLALPHLLEHLRLAAAQPLESFSQEEQFRYLLLSIIVKDLPCIQRFKNLAIATPDESKRLVRALFNLAGHYFIEPNASLVSFLSSYGIKIHPPEHPELLFEILKVLKPLKVLESLNLTLQILNLCLTKDLQINNAIASTPSFDYMLENLKKIGFDLHHTDPETGHNLISAAYELELGQTSSHFPLFRKLLSLGCNPFLLQNDGMSVYSHLCSAQTQQKIRAAAILKDLNLYEHRFLPLSFTKNILKNNKLDQRDDQGRTPLMLYVMVNIDIKEFFGNSLQKLEAKHLEAKDHKGWTVFDYARHNRDQKTLALLNKRQEALGQKANKPSIFRQAAGLAAKLATPKAPTVEASAPKASPGPSSSSKRRQARKLRAKEAGSPAHPAPAQEIIIDYNPETGTSTTSIKQVHNQAADAIAKEEAKAAAKQKKKEDKQHAIQNTAKKEGLFTKAKAKIKAVATTLETAKNLATHPQAFVQTLASKLSQTKAGERLASGQKTYNIHQAKPLARLEDGFWLGSFINLSGLAHEAIGGGKLEILPAVIKTLEAMDEAIQHNARLKIDRMKVLEAFQWIVGGKIEYGKGSHLNLRYAGGVFTIPQNKDGSDNADILYIKNAAAYMTHHLRSLLLGYEASQSTLSTLSSEDSSEDSSEMDEWNLNSSNETSSSAEGKDETPEASESEESKG